MNKVNISSKSTNRRLAFRVYEQVNLFYQKILPEQLAEPALEFDNVLTGFRLPPDGESDERIALPGQLSSLPYSESRENDTLNVNISATGIAFTSKDPLAFGDYLALRILLLSSMTTITTCCKVIYCKPSNPYEDNLYPYCVGGQFMNLTTEDRQLLSKHLLKRRKQQIVTYSLFLTALMIFLAAPDMVLDMVLDLAHQLLEFMLHAVHVFIEIIELNIDRLIEHYLHTGLHTTQIISFYISLALKLICLWFLWKTIPPRCLAFGKHVWRFWSRKKASLLYAWGEQSIFNKIKISGLAVTAVVGYVLFAM